MIERGVVKLHEARIGKIGRFLFPIDKVCRDRHLRPELIEDG